MEISKVKPVSVLTLIGICKLRGFFFPYFASHSHKNG